MYSRCSLYCIVKRENIICKTPDKTSRYQNKYVTLQSENQRRICTKQAQI